MRKFIVSIVVALVVLCWAGFYVYETNNVNETYGIKETKENNNMLSMMMETKFNSGEYKEIKASSWPRDGYNFNSDLSKCENRSNLSWDKDKKQVIFDGINKDRCYVYFDVARYNQTCDEKLFACHIAKKYTEIQGENNMYYHDKKLANGAGDNSYRYAGSSETTNNFVCFGYDSTDGTCPTDYLYRIIGVFDGQVKLIKYDYAKTTLLGTDGDYDNDYRNWEGTNNYGTNKGENIKEEIGVYHWNKINDNLSTSTWSESRLNKINLNTNYINNVGKSWANKISVHTWQVGGNTQNNIKDAFAINVYKNEIITPSKNVTYEAKIGLVYLSDYAFSASSKNWLINIADYNNVSNFNWIHMGLYEWTITPLTDVSDGIFDIRSDGSVYGDNVYNVLGLRPSFYLNSNVTYLSGKGTKELPFLIN